MLLADIVPATHEATIQVVWMSIGTGTVLVTAIIAWACYRFSIRAEEEKTKRETAVSQARMAEATERQVNGRGPDDYMRMAEASERQAKALERQANAMDRFLILEEKLDTFLAKESDLRSAAKDLVVKK